MDLERIVAAAAFCGIGGAIGGFIGALADRKIYGPQPPGRRKSTVTTILAIVCGLAAIFATGLEERVARLISPPTEINLFGKDVLAIPALQERVRGKSYEEARATLQQLVTAGLPKLDEHSMLVRAQIFAHLLAQADTPLCAGLATGDVRGEGLMQLIAKLPPEERKSWFKTARTALELEVASPAPPAGPAPTVEQVGTALHQLTAGLPREEGYRLFNNLGDMKKLPPEEACWTGRRLYDLINQAAPPLRSLLVRAMISG
jgi:hypothetical protein